MIYSICVLCWAVLLIHPAEQFSLSLEAKKYYYALMVEVLWTSEFRTQKSRWLLRERVVTSNCRDYCNILFPGLEKDKFASSRTIQNVVAKMTNLTSLFERGSSLLEHLFKHYLFCLPFPILHHMLSLSLVARMAIAEYPWLTHSVKFSSENLWPFSNYIPQRYGGYFCRKPLSSFYLLLQNMWKAIAELITLIYTVFLCF